MARQCEICGKMRMVVMGKSKLRGKYNPTVKRIQKANLQWATIPLDVKKASFKSFAGKRIMVCTKCRKTILKK